MSDLTARNYTRREMLALSGKAFIAGALAPRVGFARDEESSDASGAVVGTVVAAKVGEKILREGGNAIDAAVGAAFAACIAAPSSCGIGGYGGHAVIALAGGKKITAIDFNSIAPAAARADMFPLDETGRGKGNVNVHGWLAAGVPGTVAGLQLALERYGTRSLRDILAPAIQMCEEGVHVAPIKGIDDAPLEDPRSDSAQTPGMPRAKQRNLALARLLRTLAARNSTESFYRGDIAAQIAGAFQRNGGLVTVEDLAAYRAREVEPLTLEWNGMTLHTAPLTATGPLVLEALAILKALDWPRLSAPQRLHAKLEALRIAWADRLRTFGDPEFVKVPVERLLSRAYAGESAERVAAALKAQKPVAQDVIPSRAGGTINLSAADRRGNMLAVTITHGGGYGAKVLVDELGLILGHGMSRFDPRPGLPNSPGPRKRPVNNMCPSLVTRDGVPVFAVGGDGGTKIPNSVYEVLLNYAGLGAPIETAMAAPRLDTNGTLNLSMEKSCPAEDEGFFTQIGYKVARAGSAYISAVSFDPMTGQARGIARGGV
ncbi:MAG: gamma-glutamyltransferase [Verrucomicrobia bacterium]|nr:gamma-glutamyltransferase [Verrucomicrobiota bacterium]